MKKKIRNSESTDLDIAKTLKMCRIPGSYTVSIKDEDGSILMVRPTAAAGNARWAEYAKTIGIKKPTIRINSTK